MYADVCVETESVLISDTYVCRMRSAVCVRVCVVCRQRMVV